VLLAQNGDAGTPETDAGLPLPTFTPRADVIGEYAAHLPSEGPALNAFSAPRVQVGLDATWLDASARVLVEGAYATSGGALVGVSGDSVVIRLREAWGGYRWRFLEARAGLVPSLAIPEFERAFRFRGLSADALENARLLAPADFGGTLRVHLPAKFGWLGASLTNGEGYTSRELNPGKNVELTALIRPLSTLPLELVALGVFGSTGLPAIGTTRVGGGMQWSSPVFGAGFSGFYARGLLADATREGLVLQGFVRATLFEHLLFAARAQWFNRSLSADDGVFDALVGVGGSVAFLELFVAWARTVTVGAARTALPGVDANEVRVVLRMRWPEWSP
jgi:hypothetical protein